ncbi:hypothetical protein BV22DRAFT_691731 [Leucogyrophana mollusca]|uniref:Uncharacterized protein n=1 Tax=Leucogyrophana mollusca TaxID=85980 RepID=A0ACB8B8G9_9AGAM|nr:hypothetical protein BV22DRAFT_691731 [Leucogyrophana mollusca]
MFHTLTTHDTATPQHDSTSSTSTTPLLLSLSTCCAFYTMPLRLTFSFLSSATTITPILTFFSSLTLVRSVGRYPVFFFFLERVKNLSVGFIPEPCGIRTRETRRRFFDMAAHGTLVTSPSVSSRPCVPSGSLRSPASSPVMPSVPQFECFTLLLARLTRSRLPPRDAFGLASGRVLPSTMLALLPCFDGVLHAALLPSSCSCVSTLLVSPTLISTRVHVRLPSSLLRHPYLCHYAIRACLPILALPRAREVRAHRPPPPPSPSSQNQDLTSTASGIRTRVPGKTPEFNV